MILYNFIKYLVLHLKYLSYIKKVYKEENLITNLSNVFGVRFKEDWVHRLYAVFNPLVQSDQNALIFESNNIEGYNNNAFIEKWVMERMIAVEQLLLNKGIFDLVTYKIENIQENIYLLQIIPVTWDNFWKWCKRFMILMGCLIAIAIILIIVLL